MKRIDKLVLLLCLGIQQLIAQGNFSALNQKVPQESIYMHLNTTLLFSGEQLTFTVYCLDNAQKKLSQLSKVAHIYLVNNEGETVTERKILLQSGSGQGDLYLDPSWPTGSYKLIGLTQWMQNNPDPHFFQADIRIINPYLPVPEKFLTTSIAQDITPQGPVTREQEAIRPLPNFDVLLDKGILDVRQKAILSFTGLENQILNGTYSLSVRLKDSLENNHTSIGAFYKDLNQRQGFYSVSTSSKFLPELRGALLTGKVLDETGTSPIPNASLALSLLSNDLYFQISKTDSNGTFYFNIDRPYGEKTAYFQLLEKNKNGFKVVLQQDIPTFKNLSFPPFHIGPELKEHILKKSIEVQIENSFAAAKKDTILPESYPHSLNKLLNNHYNLDDYTRFNTIKETVVEIINAVSIIRNNEGKEIFQVRSVEGFNYDHTEPLVFVDGLYISDAETFLGYNSKDVQSVHFAQDKYFMGHNYYQGILDFETKEGNFPNTYTGSGLYTQTIQGPELEKRYYNQTYTDSQYQHVPDYRNQLLWVPKLKLNETKSLSFYTSDIPGTYEIVLEGFTAEGHPVSLTKEFQVVENLTP